MGNLKNEHAFMPIGLVWNSIFKLYFFLICSIFNLLVFLILSTFIVSLKRKKKSISAHDDFQPFLVLWEGEDTRITIVELVPIWWVLKKIWNFILLFFISKIISLIYLQNKNFNYLKIMYVFSSFLTFHVPIFCYFSKHMGTSPHFSSIIFLTK